MGDHELQRIRHTPVRDREAVSCLGVGAAAAAAEENSRGEREGTAAAFFSSFAGIDGQSRVYPLSLSFPPPPSLKPALSSSPYLGARSSLCAHPPTSRDGRAGREPDRIRGRGRAPSPPSSSFIDSGLPLAAREERARAVVTLPRPKSQRCFFSLITSEYIV